MSTVKTDAITAVSTDGDLSLDGLGTGGVSIASTLKMAKGGDIASASPLVIDTDGNYFDVTGTTNFSVMTVESGNFFMLQFDSALTITHGSGIELPGAANLTTATGDRLMCYATAANTVEVMSVETEAAAASGSTISAVSSEIAHGGGTTVDLTGMDSAAKRINVYFNGLSTNGNTVFIFALGDAGGIETSGYLAASAGLDAGGMGTVSSTGNARLYSDAAVDVFHGSLSLFRADATNHTWTWRAQMWKTTEQMLVAAGTKTLSAALTTIQFSTNGAVNNFDAGGFTWDETV
jgi:hypothetical protein